MNQIYSQNRKLILDYLIQFIGKEIDVFIDRPLGSQHPEHQDIVYQVNYGYIKDIIALDGEYQDAYVLGVDKPVESFRGVVIGIIHRMNDNEDKLIVTNRDNQLTNEQIKKEIYFQEKYFKYQIIR
ncbi:MAG: inorganic pyrophosphatase [Bacilli bacterium]|nr:inorganic pyrophosphatase [Bacilli bacterium]